MKAEREAENRRFAEIGLNSESVAYRMACDRIIECLDALTAERERADRAVSVAKNAMHNLRDLSFECFAVDRTQAPSRRVLRKNL